VQSTIFTKVSDWSLLIVVTSSIFPSKSRDLRFSKLSKEGECACAAVGAVEGSSNSS